MTDAKAEAGHFTGKVCVITGAGSGIGRALALALANRGARLAISDIDQTTVQQTAVMASASGSEVESYALDVADREAVFAHAAAVSERYGPANLVINNAGVALEASVAKLRIEDLRWLMDINFWGVVHGSQAFLPQLIDSGDGHLVNLSSVYGLIGVPGQAAYTAAKFAVRGFTESLAQEMLIAGAPVTVSCVHPGGVRTNIARSARTYRDETADERAAAFTKMARTEPAAAAETILDGVVKRAPRILIGPDARVMDMLPRVLGGRYQQIVYRVAKFSPR